MLALRCSSKGFSQIIDYESESNNTDKTGMENEEITENFLSSALAFSRFKISKTTQFYKRLRRINKAILP